MLRDFKTPEGVPEGQLDAAGDGEVLVVVDLRVDEGMVEAGIAREIVNRYVLVGEMGFGLRIYSMLMLSRYR